mmetsp:Transcript_56233/g.163014  ORF Transcript_56233/g.163014 Transcript_56233/m.163014 type:complete len:232 (-) Transcript_56233:567-1262(-)
MLCPLTRLLLLRMLALLGLPVVDVALVVAAGRRAVGRPITEAEPTELVPATTGLRANHVVATLVFLDRLVALWALLGVRPDPTDVLRLGAILHAPHVDGLATSRAVRLLPTCPTPDEAATTSDLAGVDALVLASVLAASGIRAPLDARVVVYVGKEVPLLVLPLPRLVAEALEEVDGHDSPTLVLGASGLHRGLAVIHLRVQVARPAVSTEAVATIEGNQRRVRDLHANGA